MRRALAVWPLAGVMLASVASLGDPAPGGQDAVDESAARGLEIMRRVDRRPRARDYSARATWNLLAANGRKRVRETRVFLKEDPSETAEHASRWLILVDAPRVVSGTGLLVWSSAGGAGEDLQWLYLPAFRKVRRIAGRERDEPFLGSDFSFADLIDRRADEDRHTWLREEEREGSLYDVIESLPRAEDAYDRRVHWVDRPSATIGRTEFYGAGNRHLKTLEARWERVDGVWTWSRLEMRSLGSGHRTEIEIRDVETNRGLEDRFFTATTLRLGTR